MIAGIVVQGQKVVRYKTASGKVVTVQDDKSQEVDAANIDNPEKK